MKETTKAWFDCLNAVAIELEADKSFSAQSTLINVMVSAAITLDEVREAQDMGYLTLDRSGVLNAYEGMCMEREEQDEDI